MEELKQNLNLNIQRISGTTKRTTKYFQQDIYQGSQHTSVEKNFQKLFAGGSNTEEAPVEAPSNGPLKVLFFEDIDIIFEDEKEFLYP